MLREGFAATMKDPDFIADAKRSKVIVDPRDGDYLLGIVDGLYATPRDVVEKVEKISKE